MPLKPTGRPAIGPPKQLVRGSGVTPVYVRPAFYAAQSSDDADQVFSTGVVDVASTSTELIATSGKDEWVGIRFPAYLPIGAKVLSANLELVFTASKADDINVRIWTEAADNPVPFTATTNDISSRARSAASVDWVAANQFVSQTTYTASPDLKTIVQEWVDRPDRSSTGHLALLVQALSAVDNALVGYSFDSAQTKWRLAVEFYVPAFTPLSPATETDAAQTLDVDKVKTLGVTACPCAAVALNVDKVKTLGVATETDGAQPLTFTKTIRKTLGPAVETDAAQALDKDKLKTLGIAAETDAAQPLDVDKRKALAPATETDTAQALDVDKRRALGFATETDAARPLGFIKTIRKTLGPATDTGATQALVHVKTVLLGVTLETDVAQLLGISHAGSLSIVPATETDVARPLSYTKTIFKTLGVATDTEVARPLLVTHLHLVTLTSAIEVDVALPIGVLSFALLVDGPASSKVDPGLFAKSDTLGATSVADPDEVEATV